MGPRVLQAAVLSAFSIAQLWPQSLSTQARLQDLSFVSTQIPKLDPYFFSQLNPADFSGAAASLQSQVSTLTDAQFLVGLARLVAMAGDAHTVVYLNDPNAVSIGFQPLPITFLWLDDGVFVNGAAVQYSQALGARLVAVGGTPMDQVEQALGTIIPHQNAQWLHAFATQYLRLPFVLQGLGILPQGAVSAFTFQDLAGTQFTLQLAPGNDSITYAPDPATGPTNLYLYTSVPHYTAVNASLLNLLYVRYRVCEDDPNNPFPNFAASVLQILDSNPVDSLVIDFRDNTGGDDSVIDPLLNGIAQRIPSLFRNPAFRIYDVINKGTFSSGVDGAMTLKLMALQFASQVSGIDTRLIVIGEPTGGAPAGPGNVTLFTLPGSGIAGEYPTKFISAPAGIPVAPSFNPDVPIGTRSTDYFARFDPVLAAIVAGSDGAAAPPSGSVAAVNGASFRTEQGLAPGSFAAAFGSFSQVPDQVIVAGSPGQIVSASTAQVNFLVPPGLLSGPATLSVLAGTVPLATGQVSITAVSPGLFILDPANPVQPGAVENQDFSVNSEVNPAAAGSIIQIFATGYGQLDSSGNAPVRVFIAGVPSQLLYSGPVAQYPGLWQINTRVPNYSSPQTPLKGQASVYIISGNVASNAVTIWVQ